jgi:hypothetical protein
MTRDDVFRLVDLDGFESLLDDLTEFDGNDQIVVGSLSETTREYDAEDDLLRVADFVFPREIVGDVSDALGEIDDSLLTSGFTGEQYLNSGADMVYSPTEYKQLARDVAGAYSDPVFVIGVWHPGQKYQMTGNPDNAKPRRCSRMVFPEEAFATEKGVQPLQKMSLTLQGAVVMERSHLTTEAVEFLDGDRDHLEIADRNPDVLEPEEVRELVGNLSPGDKIKVNDRSRPLTVISGEESEMFPVAWEENVFLESHGNHYRIAFDEDSSRRPELEWKSDSEYIHEIEVETAMDEDVGAVEA